MNLDFSDIKVLVVGDFMIDHYIIGESNRMSPEAPVPVIVPKEEYSTPGGAGNVAMNLSFMGSQVTCLGAIGNDIFGEKLIKIFNESNISSKHIEIIKPDVLFLLGATAAKAILSTPHSISKLRSQWHSYSSMNFNKKIKTLVSYHPAFLLRAPQFKKEAWKDLQILQKYMNNDTN